VATFAVIHGGGGSAWDWHLAWPELRARGHEAVAVDLPSEDETAGWSEYADAVVEAAGERSDIVVVAHSLGGFTAPLVCARIPVELLVLLAAMIPAPGELFADGGPTRVTRRAGSTTSSTTTSLPSSRPRRSGTNATTHRRHCESPGRSTSGRTRRRGTSCAATTACSQPRGRAATHASGSASSPDEIDGGHYVSLSRPRELADRLVTYGASAVVRRSHDGP
jgi:pimeloyl-ACP methyl ester carboxylesterase